MMIYVTIGYNNSIRFKDRTDAWLFVNNVFNSAFDAENPEDMAIGVCFKKEGEDELRSDSSSEEV